jgi:phosphopantothenoylcysteine decarboxylase/phosphopantothenate--cysteine ligase
MLRGKKILLGVCGSIAAYKAALLIRLLKKAGAEVKVIMTASARSFITPLSLSTLSEQPVLTEFEKDKTGEWNNHVELGLWADVLLIAPVTANSLGKMANAIADNLLNAVYLSARCPVVFAPAMDLDMYQHAAVRAAIEKLKSFDNLFIDSEYGELASGLVGEGRMAEPEHIVAYLDDLLNNDLLLAAKKVLITAGPTYEAIDPVRFVGNHSSGKMGLALALEAKNKGPK